MEQRRNEWVIHVWGKKRDTLTLTNAEKFHIDMLKLFQDQQKEFDRIIINIALDDINDMNLFDFLKEEIGKVIVNENVEFKYCQNDKSLCEYVTFRPYVFDRIGEDVNVFYSHFKGYNSFFNLNKESYPVRVTEMCEMFWSYIMYRYSLNIEDVKKHLDDHCLYCWYVMKCDTDNINLGYYKKYQEYIQSGNESVFKASVEDSDNKHSPGGFMWYNLKRLDKILESKPFIKNISTDYILEQSQKHVVGLCTHFSELYLMNYLPGEECYSVKDYNNEILGLEGTLYTGLYPSKKIAREFIPDFEKYLIDNELI